MRCPSVIAMAKAVIAVGAVTVCCLGPYPGQQSAEGRHSAPVMIMPLQNHGDDGRP